MKKKYSTSFLGELDGRYARPFKLLGPVTAFDANADLESLDIVAIDMEHWKHGAKKELFKRVLDFNNTLVVGNLSEQDVNDLFELTGVRPSQPAFGGIYRRIRRPGEVPRLFSNFIPAYSDQYREALSSSGKDPDSIFDALIYNGLKKHLAQSDPPGGFVTNHLVPDYVQSPFSVVYMPTWTFSAGVSGVRNLSAMTGEMDTTLYCYCADGDPSQITYYVIAVTAVKNATPGGVVQYSEQNTNCGRLEHRVWTQGFNYGGALTPYQGNTAPFSSTAGVATLPSSPAPAAPSPQILDSIGSIDPGGFSIYMVVDDKGSIGPEYFYPYYCNTQDESNVQWYQVLDNDKPDVFQAGVEFSITQSYLESLYGNKVKNAVPNTSSVDLEFISAFQFDGSLVQNNSLPILFERQGIITMTEVDYVYVYANGVSSVTQTPVSSGNIQLLNSPVYDLYQLAMPIT